MAWHFSDNEYIQAVVDAVMESFGEAFIAPLNTAIQPVDASVFNDETLLQFDLPAGTQIVPYAELSQAESIGSAVNSLMAGLAPIMSAYGMLMPIFEVIIGIIEVICALLNPFAVKRAVKRLLKKYLPKLLSLFPALAGIIIILNIIKMILAAVAFFITVVLPMVELIKKNAMLVNDAIKSYSAGAFIDALAGSDKISAGSEKISALIVFLANQLGLLKAFMPLFEMIMALLNIALKIPCKDDCCTEDICPPILVNPPSGTAALLSTSPPARLEDEYPDPGFAFNLLTNNEAVKQIKKYYNVPKEFLKSAGDDGLDVCCPTGTELDDCPNLWVEISNRRGTGETIRAPIVEIKGTTIKVIKPELQGFLPPPQPPTPAPSSPGFAAIASRVKDIANSAGYVNYTIVPNWDVLFARGITSLGCHPEIIEAKNDLTNAFSDLSKNLFDDPDINDLTTRTRRVVDGTDYNLGRLRALKAPYDIDEIVSIQNDFNTLYQDFLGDLKRRLRGISGRRTSINNSTITADKNVVRSNFTDFAVVSITPRDQTDTAILKNFPEDSIPVIEGYTTLGELSNKRFDKATGSVLYDLKSPIVGVAQVSAKVNGEFISDLIDGANVTRKLSIKFVADSVLPARRKKDGPIDKEPKA